MPGEKISASAAVYSGLLGSIRRGDYRPDDKLPSENELAERYNVSRNTVRSAIDRLATIGMVQTFQGKGTFVRDAGLPVQVEALVPQLFRESSDFISVMHLRIAVEAEAAALACVAASLEQVRELERIVTDLEKHVDNLDYFSKNDILFHEKIAAASNNQLFLTLLRMVRSILDDLLADFIVEFGNYESVYSHRKILECIKLADAEGARAAMHKHLSVTLHRFSSMQQA